MKSTRLLFILILISFGISCSKTNIKNIDQAEDKGMSQLIVDAGFNWVSGLKGDLDIYLVNPNNVSTEREIINIINDQGSVIKRTLISDGKAHFKIDLPQNSQYYIQFPVTGDEKLISAPGSVEMVLGSTIEQEFTKSALISSGEIESCTSCDNPMINSGGEFPIISSNYTIIHQDNVPGWKTTATDKKIEIWRSGFQGVPAQEGNQFFELNANQVAHLYQELCLEPGSTIMWSVWHRGRSGVDVGEVRIGATVESASVLATMTDGNTAWGYYSGTYTVPEGQNTTFFVFTSVSSAGSASYGNFLDNFEIRCDYDGDGIPDDEDDDPGNEEVAFVSYFPTSGKQIVAFEDLWPSTGDFDFNDLTMSNQVKINKNRNFIPLTAEFTISIDAIGASIHNGIGMMLYKEDGEAFNESIIASVSGDAILDVNNANGLILANDVFAVIDQYYQNNGSGPTAIPDTLKFTVTFNSNAEDFIPELYIFRSADRTHEIHRNNFPATSVMNQNLFNTVDDNGHYKTSNGLPWGLEIILEGQYKSPKEKVDMLLAYPQFGLWATSNGTQNVRWYESPVESNVFNIFQ